MDGAGSNSAFPEDDLQEELQAARAEIEKMSAGSAVATITRPGDHEQADNLPAEQSAPEEPAAEQSTPEQPVATPIAEDTPTPENNDDTPEIDAESMTAREQIAASTEEQGDPSGDADTTETAIATEEAPAASAEPGDEEPTDSRDTSADGTADEVTAATEEPTPPTIEEEEEKPTEAIEVSSADSDTSDAAPATAEDPPTPAKPDGDEAEPSEAGEADNKSTLIADADLQAELAEIEQMTGDEADAIPSLDDGNEDEPEPEHRDAAANVQAEPDSKSRLGDDELAAALAEVEQISADPKAKPSRRDAESPDTPGQPATIEGASKTDSTAADDASKKKAAATRPKRKSRFKIGKKPPNEDVAEYRPPDERGDAESVALPVTSLGKRIYRAVDQGLDTINRPFEWMEERTRTLVGWVALTTLIVSFLAVVLMPLILPHRDAIVFLEEKLVKLDAPPPAEAVDESDEGDEPSP